MARGGDHRETDSRSGLRLHEEFLELCALATSGELSEEEKSRLRAHLEICVECRQALREFETAASIGVPLLTSELCGSTSSEPAIIQDPGVDAAPAHRPGQNAEALLGSGPAEEIRRPIFASRNGHGFASMHWNYVWMSLAAAVALAAALGIYSYQVGTHRGQEVIHSALSPRTSTETLERQISDAGHERETLQSELARRETMIEELHRRIAEQSAVLAEVKSAQTSLEHSLENDQTEKQRVAQERDSLVQELDSLHASLQKTQTELDFVKQQRSQEQSRTESLEAQLKDLSGLLRGREQTIDKQEELLAHDRDIRDLMGARDLYIAEVYDVARDGTTQKPYGRVFYTRGRSLIFYAYDLDQQPGAKQASTFQAWGRGGSDRQQMLNLGLFYQDSAAKKRWVLKFNDGRSLEQIDAVFVTVEPNGGSRKPSGKPLLFASLRIDPNHP